jgi:hypothetical protein
MKYIIGAGGVGSWLTPALCLLTSPDEVTIVDGDKLEAKNLNRQLFNARDIGRFKADTLAVLYHCYSIPEWYSMGRFQINDDDWLLVCADNHPARAAALNECDARGCRAIIAANETHSSEAYYYHRAWRGGPWDPRTYYPEITTVTEGDPLGQSIGCTGEAQKQNTQLVSANFSAAALALHLYVVWAMEAPKLEEETLDFLPYKLTSNLTRLESFPINKRPPSPN